MKKVAFIKNIFLHLLTILFILKIVVLNSGCANIVPPSGGPKDTLPPRLLRIDPPDSSKGFHDKTITFTFDEYIDQPQDLANNLIVSPFPSITPDVQTKLRTLTVKIKDTLEPNTTYYFNFSKVIKDINEGVVLNNLSYIFTTGNSFDSLELSGKVILAETGRVDTTLIVMLHKSDLDSAVVKDRPRYIAKLDGKGNFRFRYLAGGKYYIYALKDETGTKKYFSNTQLFAFADSALEIKPDTPPVTLYAFAEEKEPSAPIVSLSGNRSSRGDDRRLRFSNTLNNNFQDLLGTFSLGFDQPMKNIDTSKMQITTDSTFINNVQYSWVIDSLRKNITLQTDWKENTRYNLVLDREFAEDSAGRKLLRTDTLRFTTRNKSDYGSLKIDFKGLDLSKNPVIQFMQQGKLIKSWPLTNSSFYQPLFLPGEYELYLLFDENKNGRWDPGIFFGQHKQPELVKSLDKKITVRANWDNEIEISL